MTCQNAQLSEFYRLVYNYEEVVLVLRTEDFDWPKIVFAEKVAAAIGREG